MKLWTVLRLNCTVALLSVAATNSLCADATTERAPAENEGGRFFATSVEPLLKSKCYGCHSHASGLMEGGLTLDSRSGWETGGDRGPAIIPGKPALSLLVKAIRRTDVDLSMPPDEPLSKAETAVLVDWIEAGAPDPRPAVPDSGHRRADMDWWSLRPLVRPPQPPETTPRAHTAHPVDAFIEHRLLLNGLSPAPRADRRTLIRRLYLDLHGLPPTPDAVVAFVNDPDPLAFEKLVDRLLESPRYGERWARHWLDTVHFADTHGCEHDVFRPHAWRYRDYVIDSLNHDTPWGRFIREQLAADRFYPSDSGLTPALGFIAAGPLELSRAGTAPITFDYLDRDDMVAQTMAAFASATANCARCHDHKFDPITQEDYYALQAVFAGVGKGDVEFDLDPDTARQRRQWTDLLAAATRGDPARLLASEHAEEVARWERDFGKQPTPWKPLVAATFVSSDGATLQRQEDQSWLASGTRPERDTYTITSSISLATLTALRLDVLADPSLPMNGPGRQDNGNLHLSEFEAYILEKDATEPVRLKIRSAVADWNQDGWTIEHAVDGNPATAWGIYPQVGKSHQAVFELDKPFQVKPGSQIQVVLKQLHGGGHLIGRPKVYATDAPDAVVDIFPESVRAALNVSRGERSDAQQVAIAAYVLQGTAKARLAALPAPQTVYAVSNTYSRATKLASPMSPKVVHVLRRGSIDKPGNVAIPGALSAITALPGRFQVDDPNDEAARRAALADWLAAPDNPLTWRSIVNRVWLYHFGTGICDTPNDFGRMGGAPSPPELLDWLAVWFRDEAQGSLKQLHRMLLLSSTWQRQSRMPLAAEGTADPSPRAVDARNRLLWRMNRRRLDAESFRDAVLQITGRLDLTIGGPGIQQFTQAKGAQATPKLDYSAFNWNDPAAARRSIYRVVWRGIADPFMESMDFPDLGLLTPQRGQSISSLQALTLYNSDFVLHHSQQLAARLSDQHDTVDAQVGEACRLIYLREPADAERTLLVDYVNMHGLAAMCRVLLNSNEFLFVE